MVRLQQLSDHKQCRLDRISIIAGQLNETRLLHQTAQFNQVTGAGAPRARLARPRRWR